MGRVAGLRIASAAAVRSCIANLIVPLHAPIEIGKVLLHPHQAEAVERVRKAIDHYGGALLCDPVGTGKTFSALAVGARYHSVTLVAPSVLKPMWMEAADRAGVAIQFHSHESLSRVKRLEPARGLVIVDEAHHARNPATRRFRVLSRLASCADVLLLTATPIHNRPRDLAALQSLYLGERASRLDSREVADTVIRRDMDFTGSIPAVAPIRWLTSGEDGSIAELILSLPPPLPVREGGVADVLIRHSLVRQWASSDAALRAALTKRRNKAGALISALESGTYPSQEELSAWAIADDAVQLAFAELVATPAANMSELLPVVREHSRHLDRIIGALPADSSRDRETARLINNIRGEHGNTPVIAFSSYDATAAAMYRYVAASGGVAMLTGRHGRVSGGAISRRELIARFAPRASMSKPPTAANLVTLLVATDLLSEGMNLQDAGVVVHLDLPFTHARLEQRLGRLVRLGSHHDVVHSYAFRPPASAEAIVRIEGLLGMKLSFEVNARSIPHTMSDVTDRVSAWRREESESRVIAAVRSDRCGFLAVVQAGDRARLVAGMADRITEDPAILRDVIRMADSADTPVNAELAEVAAHSILAHIAVETSMSELASARQNVHRRIARILRRAKPHKRSRMGALAERAQRVLHGGGGAHADAIFSELAESGAEDEAWLASVGDVATIRRRSGAGPCEVLAMILFTPDDT